MEMESGATVRVAVGLERACVAVGCIRVAVDVGSAEVDVGGTLVGVDGASVGVGSTLVEVGTTARNAWELPLGSITSPTITLPFDEMPSASEMNQVPAGQGDRKS